MRTKIINFLACIYFTSLFSGNTQSHISETQKLLQEVESLSKSLDQCDQIPSEALQTIEHSLIKLLGKLFGSTHTLLPAHKITAALTMLTLHRVDQPCSSKNREPHRGENRNLASELHNLTLLIAAIKKNIAKVQKELMTRGVAVQPVPVFSYEI